MLEFKNIDKFKNEEAKLKNITTALSLIRLVIAIAALVFLIIGFSYDFNDALLLGKTFTCVSALAGNGIFCML